MRDFTPKEISWLSFNARVLQEAADVSVPLIKRIQFLGIYSSNLDEFYEVRVATLKRLVALGPKGKKLIHVDPKEVLAEIQKIVLTLHKKYDQVYGEIKGELGRRNIFFLTEKELNGEQTAFVADYFAQKVRPQIFPVVINTRSPFPELKDRSAYLIVKMEKKGRKGRKYGIIELPTNVLPRFVILPSVGKKQYVMFLDDVIRFGLAQIFATTGYDSFEAYDIKVTRDAELDIEDDITTSFINKMAKSIKMRGQGNPVRLGYDENMPADMLSFLLRKLKFAQHDTIIPGGHYHNFKDFKKFPDIINEKDELKLAPVRNKDLDSNVSIIRTIAKKDVMLYYPYNAFDYVIDMLREASIDPKVSCIKITLYRVAENSSVVNALINAIKNGKEVFVLLELQARFDEENNIKMADLLKQEGATVIFGPHGLKVHSKLILIERMGTQQQEVNYCAVSTGNFNEDTARIYTDYCLLTSNRKITDDVVRIFDLFEKSYQIPKFKHLVVSPYSMRDVIADSIEKEIAAAEKGKEAYINIKVNNFSDYDLIQLMYKASQAGVKIRLIVRSMFSLVPGVEGMSENIEARCVVDNYLEHSRVLFFCNGGKESIYIASADLLPRNLDRRVEVTCPIYDKKIRQELRDFFEITWNDNVKARVIDRDLKNEYVPKSGAIYRSQVERHKYVKRSNQ